MKNLFFFSMTLLSLSSQISYGQNKAKGSEKLVVDSKQGRSNLDRSKGFGGFIFGTSIKLYKILSLHTVPESPLNNIFQRFQ